MKRSSKALRMAQALAVVAVWAGLLGYVIPAAFSNSPTVSATTASAASAASRQGDGAPEAAGSPDSRALDPVPGRHRHPGPAMVRVMQAAQWPHRVSVTLGHQPLSHGQTFASITPYRSVRPGTWTVRAVGAGEHATTRVTLAAGSGTTLVVLADHGHLTISAPGDGNPPGARPAAAASASAPIAATPKPGRSAVPWLVLGGTGLLLTLAGLARLRQLRWARRVAAHIR